MSEDQFVVAPRRLIGCITEPYLVLLAVYLTKIRVFELVLTKPPEGDRSGGGAGLGLGGVKEKLWEKRVEKKSRTEVRLDFGSSPGVRSL